MIAHMDSELFDCKGNVRREDYGVASGIIGIVLNIMLFTLKLVAGIFSKSVSVIADAMNNFSDVSASLVTLIGFKVSAKKADMEHPFGHGRMEYISGLIVSFLIILVGAELFVSSVKSMFVPSVLKTTTFTVAILFVSVFVKSAMFVYNLILSRKIKSVALKAVAKDSISDVISTTGVLAAMLFAFFRPDSKIPGDGIAGILVAVFIIWNGIDSAKDTVNPLLGEPMDKNFVADVKNVVMGFEPICGIHDVLVHDYGPGKVMISLHAEVPGDRNIFDLHQVIDDAENAVSEKFNCMVTIHMDPVDFNDPETVRVREYLGNSAKEIDVELTVHDVRFVPLENGRRRVRFDILIPRGFCIPDEELVKVFQQKVSALNPLYESEIHVHNVFC